MADSHGSIIHEPKPQERLVGIETGDKWAPNAALFPSSPFFPLTDPFKLQGCWCCWAPSDLWGRGLVRWGGMRPGPGPRAG